MTSLVILACTACEGAGDRLVWGGDRPLKLTEELGRATVVGSEIPPDLTSSVDWFGEDLAQEWQARGAEGRVPWLAEQPANLESSEDGLRLSVGPAHTAPNGRLSALAAVSLDGWLATDWSHVVIRARASEKVSRLGFAAGTDERVLVTGDPVIADGMVHTYRLDIPWRWGEAGPQEWIGMGFLAEEPGFVEVLSISIVSRRGAYAELGGTGRIAEWRQGLRRPAIFAHTPARVSYRLRLPESARFDASLTAALSGTPLTYRTLVLEAGEEAVAGDWVVEDPATWIHATADLSAWAGKEVTVLLETTATSDGAIGLWGAPTLSTDRSPTVPNVILYVIDGGGADFMSLYGYERPTTPNLQRLAQEGVVFERVHSNSAWTRPSTPSFLTSLHHSALGAGNWDSLPARAVTMAQHFDRASYQTALFTSNFWSGMPSTAGRGIDVMRENETQPNSISSERLHEDFYRWRRSYPGQPYFVHFQTTDVHEPHRPVEPYAGIYVPAERRDSFDAWWSRLWQALREQRIWYGETGDVSGAFRAGLDAIGVDRQTFFTIQRDLYDETMTHQDAQLGLLVDSLKATAEWENTILVVTADHGHPAGSYSRFGRELLEPQPEPWEGALLDSYRTRVPLLVVAPGRLEGGRRVSERVSLIDLLPTVLDLVGLPPPEIMQGQSLVPLMTGSGDWDERPVILEQYQKDLESGLEWGHIEVIDGRWGASLEVYPDVPDSVEFRPDGPQRAARLHDPTVPRLLLYDVLEDPLATRNVNDQHPDLVTRYTEFLEEQRAAHESVRQLIAPSEGQVALTEEQIETLRSLGYIQ